MTDEAPTLSGPAGERYQADVPDTLDLAHRMQLAVHALTHVWLPDEKWALAFNVDFSRRPPVLFCNHEMDAYLNIPPKFLEALLTCRLASGATERIEVDTAVLRAQLALLGEDGLTYCPADGLPRLPGPRNYSEVWAEGRTLLYLAMLAQVDPDPRWREIGRRKAERLLSFTARKEDFRFLPTSRFLPGHRLTDDVREPAPVAGTDGSPDWDAAFAMIYSIGALGHGAGLFARVTGCEPALDLAGGLARWAVARMFRNEDGRYDFWHTHHGLYALIAVCEYAVAAGDRGLLERVDACFRWMREMGDPLTGFYTEAMPGTTMYLQHWGNTVEICEVADMVLLALYLTREGVGDYWDDVDRWVRNLYAQGQITDAEAVHALPERYINPVPRTNPYMDTDGVAEKSVGAFLGWMRANEGLFRILEENPPRLFESAIMHCCTANGARTLYYVWDAMLQRRDGRATVHLLLNRASPWLDVESFLPVEGRVVLRIKQAGSVAVRIPEWCEPAAVHVAGAGDRTPRAAGRYLHLDGLAPGQCVTLTLPVPRRTVHRVLGEIPYKLELCGSTVTDIEPTGEVLPLFTRPPSGRTIRRARFIPARRDLIW